MKRTQAPIVEIFEVIDNAYLSGLVNGSSQPTADVRKWLAANRKSMSQECATFFNELGVKKKGFALALKQWLLQYQERQSFIQHHEGKADDAWLASFGQKWHAQGGVFYFQDEGEKAFEDDEVRRAHQVGVVCVAQVAKAESECHCLEVLVANRSQLNAVLKLLDRCALPVVSVNAGEEKSVINIVISSPTQSEFNQIIRQTQLPIFGNVLLA